MKQPPFYYLFCDHGTQGGIGFAFPMGFYNGKKYKKSFFGAYNIYKMLEAVDEFQGLKVSLELDSYSYEEVLKEDPECIEKLKQYISAGKVGLVGGTYAQPLGQDYGWETNIRQLTYGRKAIREVLNYDVKTFLVEEQWFHPQLPQLLKQSGFEYASLQNQNSGQVKPINKKLINWKGIDGTKIITVPANDLLVSCVRQYSDYSSFADKLKKYDSPLFFQWLEIWPPGMDWGASATPYARAFEQVKEWEGKMVTIEEFFSREIPRTNCEDIYIYLDESNYVNDWYQTGGWGYDGDKVIMEDKLTEGVLLIYETISSLLALYNIFPFHTDKLISYWKKMMLLQNHDFSVARNYRAFTENGIKTETASLGVAKYREIRESCHQDLIQILDNCKEKNEEKIAFFNSTGIKAKIALNFTINIPYSSDKLLLKQNNKEIPFQVFNENSKGLIKGLVVVELPSIGMAEIDILKLDDMSKNQRAMDVKYDKYYFEDDNYYINWKQGSWSIEIWDKRNNQSVEFKGFNGPISKQNEHDIFFPALSPGHEKFSFAFSGPEHSPDQVTDVKASITEYGPVRSTLVLHADILTLHTAARTPVAFAEARVSVNHVTGNIQCESYLYTGVYLGLQCYAEFIHNLSNSKYYRDFPFGEEETNIEAIYPNTYTRVENSEKDKGFTLIHPGVQRVYLKKGTNGGIIKHLLARDRVFGEYRWVFDLYFGKHLPEDSIKLSKIKQAYFPQINGISKLPEDFLQINNDNLVLSSINYQKGNLIVRLVNYSNQSIEKGVLCFDYYFSRAEQIDLIGDHVLYLIIKKTGSKSVVELPKLRAWEIITIKL